MGDPVGYRFRPTHVELIEVYLRPKNGDGDTSEVDRVIRTLNICRFDPWELPRHSMIQSRDQVWYFLGRIEKKYKKGDQQVRRTKSGFWKKTGKTMVIIGKSRKKIGEKWVLVFHFKGSKTKTNWVMHEYHLSPPNPSMSFTICKLKFKGEVSEVYSPPANEITHSSITDINSNNSGVLSPGSEVGQSQNLTGFEGFSFESLRREESPHLEGETDLDAMLRDLSNMSEDDFNKMLNDNEQSMIVSMQQDCNNHRPKQPLTGIMVDYTSDDSDSDSVSVSQVLSPETIKKKRGDPSTG